MSDRHPCDHNDCPRDWCYRNPENWDYDNPLDVQVKPSGDTHYHVKFNRMEFEAINQAAKRRGMNTIEYIRRMAIDGNGTLSYTTAVPVTLVWSN